MQGSPSIQKDLLNKREESNKTTEHTGSTEADMSCKSASLFLFLCM